MILFAEEWRIEEYLREKWNYLVKNEELKNNVRKVKFFVEEWRMKNIDEKWNYSVKNEELKIQFS